MKVLLYLRGGCGCVGFAPFELLRTAQESALKLAFGVTIIGRSGCDAQIWQLARMAELAQRDL
jgi:hypothetical protein